MIAAAPIAREDWVAANQRALMAEVAWIGARLRGADGPAEPEPAETEPAETPCALDVVCERFGLSAFERLVVVLAAAPELDGAFPALLAEAARDPARAYPSFGLALAVLPGAHWSALAPWAPLRHWRLVELGPGGLTAAPLRIDEWLLHALAGTGGLDPRLEVVLSRLDPSIPATSTARRAVDAMVVAWGGQCGTRFVPLQLHGPAPEPKREVFAGACGRLGWQPYVLRALDVPHAPPEREELARLWEREALLTLSALLVDGHDADPATLGGPLERFVDRLSTPVAVATAGGRVGTRPSVAIEAARPTRAEQRQLWVAALDAGEAGASPLNGTLDRVIAQFDLDASEIVTAAGQAATAGGDPGPALWEACRVTARSGLDDLAQRLETAATFDDLVLPAAQTGQLADIASQVRHRVRVYDEWQMSGPSRRGLGISALFAGPSGTGKTLAAEVLANALRLDLYRVDLSQVVSKYIGETEKNLRQIFDAAEGGGAVLLFDEADALFGRRTEVRDSHDRYANVEISYLLQRMESYRGLTLLTTNMRSALDPAFLRRLRFIVTFPFPGPSERARMWARAFGATTPTEGLDMVKLAQLSVAGGNIRNIALSAAFAAAERGGPVGMADVLRGASAEFAKLERPLSETEVAGWV